MAGPHDCEEILLPELSVAQNCTLFEVYESQLCGLIMTKGIAPEDWVNGWSDVIANDVESEQAAKYLVGIGGVPPATVRYSEAPKGADVIARRDRIVTFRVTDFTNAQYNFLTRLQCGKTDFRFWFETVGGHLFGGPLGIAPLFVFVDMPTDGLAVITIGFSSLKEPLRATWTPVDPTVPSTPKFYAYGPVFNGLEVYGPSETEYYTYS